MISLLFREADDWTGFRAFWKVPGREIEEEKDGGIKVSTDDDDSMDILLFNLEMF